MSQNQSDISKGKNLAIISYITIIGTIIAFFLNNEKRSKFAAFHVRQAFGLYLTYFIFAWLISGFDNWLATWGFWIFFLVLFFYGLSGAFNGKENTAPFLGEYYQKWFSNIGDFESN